MVHCCGGNWEGRQSGRMLELLIKEGGTPLSSTALRGTLSIPARHNQVCEEDVPGGGFDQCECGHDCAGAEFDRRRPRWVEGGDGLWIDLHVYFININFIYYGFLNMCVLCVHFTSGGK